MEINILGQLMRLSKLEADDADAYWRGVNRQATKRVLDGDLSKIPVKGNRNVGTQTTLEWDFTHSACEPTPTVYPQGYTFSYWDVSGNRAAPKPSYYKK